MATLQEHNENVFREEHQRLFRALQDSIDREDRTIRQFRQMKEDLVAVALRLQVSNQMTGLDNFTISSLRNEVTEARRDASIANKQFIEASDCIMSLKREILSLKRKVKEIQSEHDEEEDPIFTMPKDDTNAHGTTMGFGGASSFGEEADRDVDRMMSSKIKISLLNGISTSAKTTTFQEWKMQQFLFAPDTLAGSKNHDKTVVDLLNVEANKASVGGELGDRFTSSIVAKRRPLNQPIMKKEGTEEEIARSLAGIILPSMNKNRAPGSKNVWASNVSNSLLSSPVRKPNKVRI
jgi:hypothetical protein